jgi:lysozyme
MTDWHQKLRDQLKRHEGVILRPYKCPAGKITIGCGRNLTDNGITMGEAELLLEHDIKLAELYLSSYGYSSRLNDARRAALTNLLFNVGPNVFREFRRMNAALEHGHFEKAAAEMLDSKWSRQVGRRADELAEIVRTGQWE